MRLSFSATRSASAKNQLMRASAATTVRNSPITASTAAWPPIWLNSTALPSASVTMSDFMPTSARSRGSMVAVPSSAYGMPRLSSARSRSPTSASNCASVMAMPACTSTIDPPVYVHGPPVAEQICSLSLAFRFGMSVSAKNQLMLASAATWATKASTTAATAASPPSCSYRVGGGAVSPVSVDSPVSPVSVGSPVSPVSVGSPVSPVSVGSPESRTGLSMVGAAVSEYFPSTSSVEQANIVKASASSMGDSVGHRLIRVHRSRNDTARSLAGKRDSLARCAS